MLTLGQALVCDSGRGHGAGLVYRNKCIEIAVFIDPVQTMTRQFGTADLAPAQHVAKCGEAVLVEHGKAGQVRFLCVTATPGMGLFNNPGNEV